MAVAVAVAVGHGTWLLYIPARPKVVYTHQHSTGVAYIQIQLLQSTVPSIPANSTTSTGGILSGPQYYILQSYVSIYDIPYVTFRLGTFFFFFSSYILILILFLLFPVIILPHIKHSSAMDKGIYPLSAPYIHKAQIYTPFPHLHLHLIFITSSAPTLIYTYIHTPPQGRTCCVWTGYICYVEYVCSTDYCTAPPRVRM